MSSSPVDPNRSEVDLSAEGPGEEPARPDPYIHVPTVRAVIKYDLLCLSKESVSGMEDLHRWLRDELFAEYPELERVHEIVANNYKEVRAEFAQELLDVGMRAVDKEVERREAENEPS